MAYERSDKERACRKRSYYKHRERINQQSKDKYYRNRDAILARHRETRTYDKTRRNMLKAKYGLDPATYEALLVLQGGVCAICGELETAMRKGHYLPLVVDHDHETGSVRGLLCAKCNVAIGMFRDKPILARAAAAYLEMFLGG